MDNPGKDLEAQIQIIYEILNYTTKQAESCKSALAVEAFSTAAAKFVDACKPLVEVLKNGGETYEPQLFMDISFSEVIKPLQLLAEKRLEELSQQVEVALGLHDTAEQAILTLKDVQGEIRKFGEQVRG